MSRPQPPAHIFGLLVCLFLVGCEGSPWGQSLEKTLEPDPRLLEEDTSGDTATSAPEPATPSPPTVSPAPESRRPASTEEIAPSSAEDTDSSDSKSQVSDSAATSPSNETLTIPEFTQASYVDVDEAPEELQTYLEQLVELDVLLLIDVNANDDVERNPNEFLPNQTITRREYARWLLATNNRFYQDQATKKIRPAVNSSQPAFQDVGVTNIDFPAIQGLAEAGIIPSRLNGTATAVKFRPNAPLTREDLIFWKVPLDQRTTLAAATVAAVTETWGFQDASQIDPMALKAVLADHTNGEFANIRRALGYTTLFQPDKEVTRAEAAAVLWRFGNSAEGITASELLSDDQPGDDALADSETADEPAVSEETPLEDTAKPVEQPSTDTN